MANGALLFLLAEHHAEHVAQNRAATDDADQRAVGVDHGQLLELALGQRVRHAADALVGRRAHNLARRQFHDVAGLELGDLILKRRGVEVQHGRGVAVEDGVRAVLRHGPHDVAVADEAHDALFVVNHGHAGYAVLDEQAACLAQCRTHGARKRLALHDLLDARALGLQGDVVGILDREGKQVAGYRYDPWGKLLSCTGELADSIGAVNPLRYRGYYYDSESGLYYLNSRYYDPETGRFLNADWQMDENAGLLKGNLYVYCANNPVKYQDEEGEGLLLALGIGAVFGAAISFATSVVTQVVTKGKVDWREAGIDTVAGAVSGMLAVTGVGRAGQALGNAVISGIQYAVTEGENATVGGLVQNVAAGAIAGFAGGNGLDLVHQAGKIGSATAKQATVKSAKKATMYATQKAVAQREIVKAGVKFIASNVFTKIQGVFNWKKIGGWMRQNLVTEKGKYRR